MKYMVVGWIIFVFTLICLAFYGMFLVLDAAVQVDWAREAGEAVRRFDEAREGIE